jgi:hypothetical protein
MTTTEKAIDTYADDRTEAMNAWNRQSEIPAVYVQKVYNPTENEWRICDINGSLLGYVVLSVPYI